MYVHLECIHYPGIFAFDISNKLISFTWCFPKYLHILSVAMGQVEAVLRLKDVPRNFGQVMAVLDMYVLGLEIG